jgi:hypothetical protein
LCLLYAHLFLDSYPTSIFKKQNPEETWTVWKETLALLLVLVFIAFGNLCYGNLIRISHLNFQELLLALAGHFFIRTFSHNGQCAFKIQSLCNSQSKGC